MNDYNSRVKVKRKTGNEIFSSPESFTNPTVHEFWQWAFSDLSTNTMRGIVAEFIVASALGVTRSVRKPWLEYDLITKSGLKIEVKSAAYLQSWPQDKESLIVFSIGKTRRWEYLPSRLVGPLKRHADLYVFCILNHKQKRSLNPLNLEQWEFYIIDTKTINRALGEQKKVSLNKLLKLNPEKTNYDQLKNTVNCCGRSCKRK